MAAVFYKYAEKDNTIFKGSININENVHVGFLYDLVGPAGVLINEVTVQHRDTIQYFLTFDDVINYFYFGKGLGSLNISGCILSDCNGNWPALHKLMNRIGSIRGKTVNVFIGGISFTAVLSSFTLRASADITSLHIVDFNFQLDIIDSSLPSAVIKTRC
jgi:hypothetical protein